MNEWRVGHKLGRTLYRNDVCVGMVDNSQLATELVEATRGVAGSEAIRDAKQEGREEVLEWLRKMQRSPGIWENGPAHLAHVFEMEKPRR